MPPPSINRSSNLMEVPEKETQPTAAVGWPWWVKAGMILCLAILWLVIGAKPAVGLW